MEAAARAAKDSGRAVPLITQDDSTGKYVVSEEALELLAGIEAPLAVVAIAGLWRTGKSYLLNQFSGAVAEKKGFAVGATVNACTKGLWLWGQPVKLEDGLSVLFVDTEGLGSTSRTQTEDSQIFSLALLLSSLFVWNSRGVIDGNALEDFALVVNLTKHIHVRSDAANKALTTGEAAKKDGGAPAKKAFVAGAGGPAYAAGGHELDSLAEHFPSFMWVVRDFTLRLEDGGRKINDRQYLENALKPQTSFSSEAASRNQIRTLLSSFFRERDCVTLVRPAEDEAVLRDLSNRELHELRPEFQAGLAKLKGKVFASVRAKAVKGRALSGKMLGTLAQTYAEALNSGSVPTIATAWDRVLQSQAAEAMNKALQAYDDDASAAMDFGRCPSDVKALLSSKAAPPGPSGEEDDGALVLAEALQNTRLPLDSGELCQEHERLCIRAEAVYHKAVWTDDSQQVESSSRDLALQLDQGLAQRLHRLRALNSMASKYASKVLLDELCQKLESSLDTLAASAKKEDGAQGDDDLDAAGHWLDAFSLECATLQSTYAAAALGPAKWEVLLNCGADRVLAQATGWATRLGVDHRKAQKKLRGNVSAAQEARQSVSGKLGASESAAQRELLALERAAGDAEVAAKVEVEHLDAHLANRMRELQHHKDAQARLQRAFDFAGELLDKQTVLQKELADGLRTSLASIRDKLAVHEEEPRRPDWEGNEAAFERDELAEFASSNLTELKERVAEDEKELELMHEHAALTIEHAKVKKMLLADKDHELQEYEYQWGVAKANVSLRLRNGFERVRRRRPCKEECALWPRSRDGVWGWLEVRQPQSVKTRFQRLWAHGQARGLKGQEAKTRQRGKPDPRVEGQTRR